MPSSNQNPRKTVLGLEEFLDQKLVPAWVLRLQYGLMNPLGFNGFKKMEDNERAYWWGKIYGVLHFFSSVGRIGLSHREHCKTMLRSVKICIEALLKALNIDRADPRVVALEGKSGELAFLREVIEGRITETRNALAIACYFPHADAVAFFFGFAEGFAAGLPSGDKRPEMRLGQRRLYEVLLGNWEHVETLHSMKAIHEWLPSQPQLPQSCIGDLPSFTRLCNRFGLTRGRTGRPRKSRT